MFLAGRWYDLAWEVPAGTDVVSSLDVSVLQDRFLAPVLGIDDRRFEYTWVSASEGARWQQVVTNFTDRIHKLGPAPRLENAEPLLQVADMALQPLRPLGTGQNAKTPAGTLVVKDKIEHPDWWSDGGKVIPYGDPANVLGTHWLALEATGETPRVSGYGIHGTWDDTTLGKQSSAGCVRMSNADVRELFLFLPRQTPVTIVE